MTAKDNSLQRFKIEFEYQEDIPAYRQLINRIKQKRRIRTMEKNNVSDTSKKS